MIKDRDQNQQKCLSSLNLKDQNILILIPARYHSSRFPGKPLEKIHGKSMIEYVYESANATQADTAVVTDHPLIEEEVKKFKGNVLRVDDDLPSGSDRVYLAYKKFYSHLKNYKLIINLQGDEPLITVNDLILLANFHLSNLSLFDISTLLVKKSFTSEEEEHFNNPNVVKTIFSPSSSKCHYFSRSPIPYRRDKSSSSALNDFFWYQHIGIYSYTPFALEKFISSSHLHSPFSELENLEQLRAIDGGLTIGGQLTTTHLIGVDRPQDLEKVSSLLQSQSKKDC